jgi:transposase-like protein
MVSIVSPNGDMIISSRRARRKIRCASKLLRGEGWGRPLCEEIDDKVKAFLDRPLEGDSPYVWLDATYVIRDDRLRSGQRRGRQGAVAQDRRPASGPTPGLDPGVAGFMDEAEEDVLAYRSFPAEHGSKIHSTNGLERLNGEVERRTEVAGIFPNDHTLVRLVGAILLEQNDEWAVRRARYMTLAVLQSLVSPQPA